MYSFIEDTLIEIADAALERFEVDHAINGHNGPYGHDDTPTRNTAHWVIIFSYLWRTTGNSRYYDAAIRFSNYLVGIQASSLSGAVKCMENSRFDHMNGLMGQAWFIEAMIEASKITGDDKYYEIAKKVFFVPDYDKQNHLWERVELDGTNIGYDITFNYQLWFASADSLLQDYKEDSQIDEIVRDCLCGCKNHFRTYENGLVKHYGDGEDPYLKKDLKSRFKRILKKTIFSPFRRVDPYVFNIYSYEEGYHLFNMYGFALMYNRYKDCEIFKSDSFEKAVNFALNIDYLNDRLNIIRFISKPNKCKMNRFAYGYNSPAFEFPYVSYVFSGKCENRVLNNLFELQLKATYDKEKKMFSRNNMDGETLTARVYELIRFLSLPDKSN